jgi:hypothetical protein
MRPRSSRNQSRADDPHSGQLDRALGIVGHGNGGVFQAAGNPPPNVAGIAAMNEGKVAVGAHAGQRPAESRIRAFTFLDQGLSSLTNFGGAALAAGLLSSADFGAFAVATSVLVLASIHRSVIGVDGRGGVRRRSCRVEVAGAVEGVVEGTWKQSPWCLRLSALGGVLRRA